MNHWQNVVREWLYLDSTVRFELLGDYPEIFTPIRDASISAVTYYTDMMKVSELWEKHQSDDLKERLDTISPALKRAIKGLAIMVSDGKAFLEPTAS